MPADTIDPDVLLPSGEIGRATGIPDFYDEVIGAINDHAARIDAGGGGGISFQEFTYTVTGSEPDRSELAIAMPFAEPATTYNVHMSQGTAAYQLGMNVAASSKTLAGFVLSLSGLATAGDTFIFSVIQP